MFEDLQIPPSVNKDAAELLHLVLDRSPARRPTFETILSHKWMEMRKLFGTDTHEHDWEVEYSMVRNEATATITNAIMVGEPDSG